VNGGYDAGYLACPCFWGREPGRLVRHLTAYVSDFRNIIVLDAGCGEGKNAAFLAERGARVRAVDVSEAAIRNGKSAFDVKKNAIRWQVGDIRTIDLDGQQFDIVIAYGLLHCLPSELDICNAVHKLQVATRIGGYNALCALNSRSQDLSAHPDLSPTLLGHEGYMALYAGWEILEADDSDLTEVHPHNNIKHTHSLTRMLARKR
jgi:tellurite methyltransferase